MNDDFLQFLSRFLAETAFLLIVFIQLLKVAVNLLVGLFQTILELAAGEVAVAGVGRLELGSVDGYQLTAKQVGSLTEPYEFTAQVVDGVAINLAEIGNGFEVGSEVFEQPENFKIAIGFTLQGAAGTDGEEIAIEVKTKKISGMVGWAAMRIGFDPGEAQFFQIEAFDESIQEADRIIPGDIVLDGVRHEGKLITVDSLDMFHLILRINRGVGFFHHI